MGTDDLFHKDRVRKAESLRRKLAKRAPYDVVLIVCEGKTEHHYFSGLRDVLRLNNANIIIADKIPGTAPVSVVDFAIEKYKKEKDLPYDRVYCVFDKDKHTTYTAALNKVKDARLKKGSSIHAITSVPCFEIWLLLHYTYTTHSFCAAGDESNCKLVVAEIKRHIPGYQKGSKDVFATVADKMDIAITNAKKLENFHKTSGTDNPSTMVHELVEYLQNLKSKIYEAKR